MKTGGIGVVTSTTATTRTIDTSSFPRVKSEGEHTLRAAVEEDWTQQDFEGGALNKGRAAKETLESVKTAQLSPDGKIETGGERPEIVTHVTDFLRVPGEFVITNSTTDEFAYDLLKESTGETIHPAVIDLEAFVEANPSVEFWMGWFRDENGPLDAGSAYGAIVDAPDIEAYIRAKQNTQLGLKNLVFNGRSMKIVITRSGWVAVYEPREMDSVEFAQFIREKVHPHARPDL